MPVAKDSGGSFEPVPPGTHAARAVNVISLGTQPSNNPAFPPRFKVMIGWELPDETIDVNGEKKPMMISKEYTLALSEKANLRHDLESWRGKPFSADELAGFAVEKLIGAPCLLTVIHKEKAGGKTYANISSVSKLPKSMTCPDQVNESVHYEIEQGRDDVFDQLPEWIQRKISNCAEWKEGTGSHDATERPADDEGDDIPF